MRPNFARTKAVREFIYAMKCLEDRSSGMEGMGVLYGKSGTGKTTAVATLRATTRGVVIVAKRSWTEKEMLRVLASKLGVDAEGTTHQLLEGIIKKLRRAPRPVFVDEADYLLPERITPSKWKSQGRKLDTLRDIYNETRAPIVLVGEERVGQMLAAHDRFRRRVTQWIRFDAIDLADARTVANECCEVDVSDDLLARVHEEAGGRICYVVICLEQVEVFARSNRLSAVSLNEWGDMAFQLGHPDFPGGRV